MTQKGHAYVLSLYAAAFSYSPPDPLTSAI
jgi:hypothetical protein